MADSLEDALRTNAANPKRVKGDSGEVEQHPLLEQIEAVRFLNSQKAAKAKRLGIRVTKMIPPGTE